MNFLLPCCRHADILDQLRNVNDEEDLLCRYLGKLTTSRHPMKEGHYMPGAKN